VSRTPIEQVAFGVLGPLPRFAPYKRFRSRIYVPSDTRKWRTRVATAFLEAGGRRPKKDEQVFVYVRFTMVKSHADLDSLYHSLQDALSRDALHCVDKEWHFQVYHRRRHVSQKSQESVLVEVTYGR